MEWYLPITIIPGVGMLILSTVHQTLALSTEIGDMLAKPCSEFEHRITDQKINQLGLLTRSSALLYLAAGCYVLSGILGALLDNLETMGPWPEISLYIGTLFVFLALGFLILYAFRAVSIRKIQYEHNHQHMSVK